MIKEKRNQIKAINNIFLALKISANCTFDFHVGSIKGK